MSIEVLNGKIERVWKRKENEVGVGGKKKKEREKTKKTKFS